MNECPDLILVRHGEVDLAWKGICYGAMDVQLSEDGAKQSLKLAELLCRRWQPRAIYHSGLVRTRFLAEAIAQACSMPVPVQIDTRIQERNFGAWQGLTWDDAYASDPDNFHGLIDHPDTYRPPQGETTSEMQSRAISWLAECDLDHSRELNGPIIAVSHSGPIAAIAGHFLHLHAREWEKWTIRTLECLSLSILPPMRLSGNLQVKCSSFDLLACFDLHR
jgi:broad specificity phosphatase PhoE